ncbi:MAG: hypothetical protein HQL45_15715 [Alphaproteobacteria bacterium]|nr:hypothetical protein [Alphaproteobacteria bacterium]
MAQTSKADNGQGQSILSDRLEALIDQFTLYLNVGMELKPEAVAVFIMILESCRDEAEALEEAAQRHFEGRPIPADVLKIATLLSRNGVSAGMPKGRG